MAELRSEIPPAVPPPSAPEPVDGADGFRPSSGTGFKLALGLFVAVLVGVALLPFRSYLSEPREVIASTPSAYTGLTVPLTVPARGEACADEILFDTDARVARFGATARARSRASALEVVARGYPEGEYRSGYRSVARVPGGWTGTRQLDVALRPPPTAVFGTFCVRNLGNRPVDLVGSEDGRAYSRPSVKVNGQPVPIELQLRLLDSGYSSLLSRSGQIMQHAAASRPFGAWWWWLLGLATMALAPLGVALAMRSALAMDAAAPRRRRAGTWPFARLRRRVESVPGWAIVGAVGAIAALWLVFWGVNTHVFQNDEDQYVYLSRWLQDGFPSTLWNFDIYGRGLQRLEVWLLAIPAALFDSPWSLIGGRVLNTLAFVSTGIPVYLLGRGMGLRSQWAALPAAVSMVVPWAVVTTALLTENVAYPACFWAVWAIWRTAVEPGLGRDALALALLLVAGLSRSALLLLAPVLPLSVVIIGMRCGAGSAVARVRALLRDHILLWTAVAVAALPLLFGALGLSAFEGVTQRLAGGYPTQFGIDTWTLVEKLGRYFSRVVVGTGFLAAVVALPWIVRQLARPADKRSFALATVVVLTGVALLYSLAPAGSDERYIVYLGPLVLLPATLAIARRDISPLGLAIASVLLAALLMRVTWVPEQGAFGFFVVPVEMFYSRVLGLRLGTYLPGDADDALTVVAVAFGVTGVVIAALLRWARGRLFGGLGAALVAAVVAVVVVQTNYAVTKYVNGAGSRTAADLQERAFADQRVPDGATVAQFSEGVGLTAPFLEIWQEVQFYNQRIDRVFTFGRNFMPVPPGDGLVENVGFNERTGRVRSPEPLPDYVVIPSQIGSVRLRGTFTHLPTYIPVALMRVAKPAGLAWRTTGFDPPGIVPRRRTAGVRFYAPGAAPGAYCAGLEIAGPPDRGVRWRLKAGGTRARSGRLGPGERRRVSVRLPRVAERGWGELAIAGDELLVLAMSEAERC